MSNVTKVFNLIKKVAWWICCGIFGIVFLITAWLFVDKFVLQSPVPSFLGYSSLTIETGSMSGTMEIGDMIIIKDTGDYKIGDIVTFMPDGATIPTTHRIINYTETGEFVTKGDANNIKDTDTATKDQIYGEVVLHLPKLGQFASWVRMEGWIYVIATLAIIALGVYVSKSSEGEKAAETADGAPQPIEPSEPAQPIEPTAEEPVLSEPNIENNGDSPEEITQ